jgi:Uma2 family endonuclease
MYASQQNPTDHMTEEEYFDYADAHPEEKFEYVGGRVVAMSGGSVRHGIITVNISTQFNIQLAAKECSTTSPDVRVQTSKQGKYRYPDVMVFCGEPIYREGRTDTITNPVALVEVSSPGTSDLDRNEKLTEYTQIASLAAYILVAQDEKKIECFSRLESGGWFYDYVTGDTGALVVPSVDVTLSLEDVYRKVRWDDLDPVT